MNPLENRLADTIGDIYGYTQSEKILERDLLKKRAREIIDNMGSDKVDIFIDVYYTILYY